MPMRPLSDFHPRERVAIVPHTTRRFACRSTIALSPDGHTLAVVSDRGAGTYEAWTLPVHGGTPQRAVTVEDHAVRSLCWSASGELIAAADRGGTELHQLYVRHPDGPNEPLSVDPAGKVQRLLSWNAASPDGRTVAFSSNARASTDMDVVIADLATRTERPLLAAAAWHVVGGWSPDGRQLLVMRVHDNTTQDLLVVDAASGAAREITVHSEDVSHVPAGWLADGRVVEITDIDDEHLWLAALDPATGARESIDRGAWDVELASSSADGRVQAWVVNEDGYSKLRWRVEGGPIREYDIKGVCENVVLTPDGSRLAYLRISATQPWDVWTVDTATGESTLALATSYDVPSSELVEPELIRIPGPEGDIPCFVYRPKNARAPYPAILYPHGGPEGQSRPAFSPHLMHLAALVDRGFALVVPNIHGSTGYGRAWQAAIHRDWGGIDLRDLRAVTAWMQQEAAFDQRRLAVYGGSYGGFATLLCVTHMPDVWRCAVDVFGVANLVTMIENAQPNWRRFLTRWIGDLATDREKLVERSPITHIANVKCPMLILQGSNDPRVPQEESDQVVEKLRAMGRRVEYVVYPDEGHGFTKKRNAEDAYGRIVEFLTKELSA
ncbi:MAG TPA: S9 family peptidase [Candidatus Limnocylindria bacterium]|nr:S9 family peptidase [Candidatus Limnocylindria bacterium]